MIFFFSLCKTPYTISVIFKYKILKGIIEIVSFPFFPTPLKKESNVTLKRWKGGIYEGNLNAVATSFAAFISQHLLLQIG